MSKKISNQAICLKEYISEKDYREINALQELCSEKDKTNLKLELDYRLNVSKDSEIGFKKINEFLYYVDNVLVSYIAISSFGGNVGEINGMTHPDWRRKGIFKKLFELAINECRNRNFKKILLLSDGKSNSGVEFIKSVGGEYSTSEYRMKCTNKVSSENISPINLRQSDNTDRKEIARQNSIFFNGADETQEIESFPEEEEAMPNEFTYMIEVNGETIGKIRVEYNDTSAFIAGFGILPTFRGKGYGKAALKKTLSLINNKNIFEIELDVECKNDTALNLYTSCGFEQQSVMNYYEYNL